MDKISAALIFGIVSLVFISGLIVFDTWIVGDSRPQEVTAAAEQGSGEELVFNDDTSITSCTGQRMWLRARITYEPEYDGKNYRIVSRAIEKKLWALGRDGWYYYTDPVQFAQTTEPLIDELFYREQKATEGRSGRFSLQVEAVDQSWLLRRPASCPEAFQMLDAMKDSWGGQPGRIAGGPPRPLQGLGL